MDFHTHNLPTLFAQLGLPAEPAAVERFIDQHRPLPEHVQLADAPFWSPSQSSFLCEQILCDADWADVVDELNIRLHS